MAHTPFAARYTDRPSQIPNSPSRSLQPDRPQPLQVLKKRHETPRKSSTDTDESAGSAPEPPYAEASLTVRKRRDPCSPHLVRRGVRPERSFIRPKMPDPDPGRVHSSGNLPGWRSNPPPAFPLVNSPGVQVPSWATGSTWDTRQMSPLDLGSCESEYAPSPGLAPIGSYTLVPSISVTPELNVLRDVQTSLWAAVQVSGRLSRTLTGNDMGQMPSWSPMSCLDTDRPCDTDMFSHGCLYNLAVEIRPAPDTEIIDVIHHELFPTTLGLRSRILLLANIRIDPSTSRPKARGHIRQRSDDLIEDLEIQLGSAPREYMHIRVSYSHSGFPEQREPGDGVTMSTRIETTATAVIKCQDARSPWSPRPSPALATNHICNIIAANWDAERADHAIDRILARRPGPQKSRLLREGVGGRAEGSLERLRQSVRTAPPVPIRQASLNKEFPVRYPALTRTGMRPFQAGNIASTNEKSKKDEGRWGWGWW